MLVLSRRKEESIVIDGNIEVEVLKVSGNTVRLGIKAPREVKILRGELAPFGKESSDILEINVGSELGIFPNVSAVTQVG